MPQKYLPVFIVHSKAHNRPNQIVFTEPEEALKCVRELSALNINDSAGIVPYLTLGFIPLKEEENGQSECEKDSQVKEESKEGDK